MSFRLSRDEASIFSVSGLRVIPSPGDLLCTNIPSVVSKFCLFTYLSNRFRLIIVNLSRSPLTVRLWIALIAGGESVQGVAVECGRERKGERSLTSNFIVARVLC